jgi:AcrR family transcriptional regulator
MSNMTRPRENAEDGRARHAQINRERIYQAAVRMFIARGYDSATMQEIAVEAGVTRRTAFNHFAAKGDIAVEWAVRRGEAASTVAREAGRSAQRVPDRLCGYFHELAVMTERDWHETRQMTTGLLRGYGTADHRSWVAEEPRAWIAEWLDHGSGQGTLHKAAGPALITDALYDLFQGVLLRWLPRPAPPQGQFTAEVDAVIGLLLTGFKHGVESG